MARTMARRIRRWTLLAAIASACVATTNLAEAAGVTPADATAAQRAQAQRHFLRGKDLHGASKFEQALVEFRASFDVVASPNARLYIARCLRDLGRDAEAYGEFTRVISDAKDAEPYQKTGTAAAEEREQLSSKIAFLDFKIDNATSDTTLKVRGEDVPRDRWGDAFAASPGATEIVVTAPGHAPVTKNVEATAGQHHAITLDAFEDMKNAPEPPPPPPPPKMPLRTLALAAGGVAAVGLGTFIVAGAMSNSTYSKLQEACGGGPCPPGHESDVSAGRTQQTIANVGVAVFVTFAAAGVTLWVLGGQKDDPAKTEPAPAQPKAAAKVVAGPSFVGLVGAF